ncbi:response regulator [Roseococcus sp. DSY-14]|uniref:response regulator n=1 Tax=Roseococcus sp. DSY-14 TaxID=3369650 RepID=UPI00387A83D7
MTALDEELRAALRPEWAADCGALAAAPDAAAAQRALARLRAMAGGVGLDAPFPAADAPLEALRAAAPALAGVLEPPAAAAPLRVLVVDDSRTIRRLLREVLDADPALAWAGEASDGAEGLRKLAALAPDLTLLDLEMPVLDGMGFLAEWALVGGGEVIIVSSAAPPGSATALEALRRGALACVAKPSGALSPDLAARAGDAIRAACRLARAP